MYHIKNDKRSIQSSIMIYDALVELIQEKNYVEITVSEVVDRAKLGRTTFYRNFDSIDDVLRMKCDEKFHKLKDYLIEYYKENRSIPSPHTPFLKPFLRYWYVNSSILEQLIKANRTDIIKESFLTMCHTLATYIPKETNILFNYSNYFIEIRSAVVISILTEWIKNNKNIAPDDLADILLSQMKEMIKINLLL